MKKIRRICKNRNTKVSVKAGTSHLDGIRAVAAMAFEKSPVGLFLESRENVWDNLICRVFIVVL